MQAIRKFQCQRCGLCCVLPTIGDDWDKKFLVVCEMLRLGDNGLARCAIYGGRPRICRLHTHDIDGLSDYMYARELFFNCHKINRVYWDWFIQHHPSRRQELANLFFKRPFYSHHILAINYFEKNGELVDPFSKINRLNQLGYFEKLKAELGADEIQTGLNEFFRGLKNKNFGPDGPKIRRKVKRQIKKLLDI